MPKLKNDKTFDFVAVVDLTLDLGGKGNLVVPSIDYQYPPRQPNADKKKEGDAQKLLESMKGFCFPDLDSFPSTHVESEPFSFVLTDSEGGRRFGYCKRSLPQGTMPRFPICCCVVTFNPCFPLFIKLLAEVERRYYYGASDRVITDFLAVVLANPFPSPGQICVLTVPSFRGNNAMEEWRFTRPDDSDNQLEYVEFEPLLKALDPIRIVAVFAALLAERRIIFSSAKLSKLTSCVQACVALLYPFTWQHIYVPVLPRSLLNFCCAPMPFVVGVLETYLPEVGNLPLDEVMIVDLDDNEFIRIPHRDYKLMPPYVSAPLLKTLTTCSKVAKKGKKAGGSMFITAPAAPPISSKKLIADAFTNFFVGMFVSYRQYMRSTGFDMAAFLRSQPSSSRKFLELFTGSQMFERFVEERIADTATVNEGQFERRITVCLNASTLKQELARQADLAKEEDEWDKRVDEFMKGQESQKESSSKFSSMLKTGFSKIKDSMTASSQTADDLVLSEPTFMAHSSTPSEHTAAYVSSQNAPPSSPQPRSSAVAGSRSPRSRPAPQPAGSRSPKPPPVARKPHRQFGNGVHHSHHSTLPRNFAARNFSKETMPISRPTPKFNRQTSDITNDYSTRPVPREQVEFGTRVGKLRQNFHTSGSQSDGSHHPPATATTHGRPPIQRQRQQQQKQQQHQRPLPPVLKRRSNSSSSLPTMNAPRPARPLPQVPPKPPSQSNGLRGNATVGNRPSARQTPQSRSENFTRIPTSTKPTPARSTRPNTNNYHSHPLPPPPSKTAPKTSPAKSASATSLHSNGNTAGMEKINMTPLKVGGIRRSYPQRIPTTASSVKCMTKQWPPASPRDGSPDKGDVPRDWPATSPRHQVSSSSTPSSTSTPPKQSHVFSSAYSSSSTATATGARTSPREWPPRSASKTQEQQQGTAKEWPPSNPYASGSRAGMGRGAGRRGGRSGAF
eukprot:TRINITY_DN1043_c1_g1_i1.p1 TRINITY_DN1043_c1_g1~~TRINITY_DN1043_c1_g1_i1.p1  ORF type:complete len:956 (+),score=166.81 TRINITY_DN1043_c1_g1_i1:479-3346(+)